MATPLPIEIDGRILALQAQRNNALDEVVLISGILAAAHEKIKMLEDSLQALEAENQKGASENAPSP